MKSIQLILGDILKVLESIESVATQASKAVNVKEEWLDSFDMLERFHISRTTLHRLKKSGDLIPSKLGKKDVYLLSEVQHVLKSKPRITIK